MYLFPRSVTGSDPTMSIPILSYDPLTGMGYSSLFFLGLPWNWHSLQVFTCSL